MFDRVSNLVLSGLIAGVFVVIGSAVMAPGDFNCAVPTAHAAGASYLRQDNPVCRQSFQLWPGVRLIDAGEGQQDDQETDPDTHKYPGREIFTEDQYVAVYRDGGTPHYERLAFASAANPVAVPEWIPTSAGTTIIPVRGNTWDVGVGRDLINDVGWKLQVGDGTVDRGHVRIEGQSTTAVKANLSVLGGPAGSAEVQLISEDTGVGGFSELHTITDTPLHLGTNDTRWMTIKETSGHVGIGTEDPGGILHVVGINDVDGVPAQIAVSDSDDETKRLHIGYDDTWDAGSIAASDISTGWKPVLLQPISGNVGIGINPTTQGAPGTLLQVDGNVTVGDDATAGSFVHIVGADVAQDFGVRFGTEADPDNAGAVRFNTSGGGMFFDIAARDEMNLATGSLRVGNDSTNGSVINVVGAGAAQDFGIQFGTEADPDNAGSIVHNTAGGGMFFEIAGNEEMRLTATGLAIGLAGNPDSLLHVYSATAGAVTATGGTQITVENSADTFITILSPETDDGGIYFGAPAPSSNKNGGVLYNHPSDVLSFLTSAAVRWQINALGNLRGPADNRAILFGAADDMSIYYDGADGYINTTLVAPSDLHVTTGAAKTLVLDTEVYDDLRIVASAINIAGPGVPPSFVAYKGGAVIEFPSAGARKVYFEAQIPHMYAEEKDIQFHLHVVFDHTSTGNVHWNFTYSWANINSNFPAETTVSVDLAASGVTDKHVIHEIAGTITGTGKTISSVLICSLERNPHDGGDTLAESVFLVSADFHYPVNTMGSRTESTK